MKFSVSLLISVLFCLPVSLFASGNQQHPFEYLYPLPNTQHHNTQTTLILRTGYALTDTDMRLLGTTQIIDTEGNLQTFSVTTARNRRVAILNFKKPLPSNTYIHVHFPTTLRGSNQQPIGRFEYGFGVGDITPAQVPQPTILRDTIYPTYHPNLEFIQYAPTSSEGELLLALPAYGNYRMMITDNDANLIKSKNEYIVSEFKFHKNNELTATQIIPLPTDNYSYYHILDTALNKVTTIKPKNGFENQGDLHDIIVTDSSFIVPVWERITTDLTYLGGLPNCRVKWAIIQEIDRETDQVVFVWRAFDYFQVTDTDSDDFSEAAIDLTHLNSLDLDSTGNLLVSFRSMSEITKINRTTGNIIWRFSGKNNQFTFIDDPLNGTSYQHHARYLPNGHITVFDNGNSRPIANTRAVEYELDETNKTARLIWSCPSPNEKPTIAMGSIQTFPDGSRLINWGRIMQADPIVVTEIDNNCNILFQIRIKEPLSASTGNYNLYRVYRFPWLQFLANYTSHTTTQLPTYTVQASPNPCTDKLQLTLPPAYINQLTTITLTDAQGRIVQQIQNTPSAGTPVQVSTQHLAAGIYFYHITSTQASTTGKFIKK